MRRKEGGLTDMDRDLGRVHRVFQKDSGTVVGKLRGKCEGVRPSVIYRFGEDPTRVFVRGGDP